MSTRSARRQKASARCNRPPAPGARQALAGATAAHRLAVPGCRRAVAEIFVGVRCSH